MSGGVSLDADQLRRVRSALRDAEIWTAKWCADNHATTEVGLPIHAGVRALERISAVYTEIGRLPR